MTKSETNVALEELMQTKRALIKEYASKVHKGKITKPNRIHIHTQQLKNRLTNERKYAPWTKNEKGISKGGRYFPLTGEIRSLPERLKKRQNEAVFKM